MKVKREPLDGTSVQRLVVIESVHSDHHPGECIGYLCGECMAADETLRQLYHEGDCSLAGQHGRKLHPDHKPILSDRRTPELDSRHPINVIVMGETEGRGGLHEGEVLGFECGMCGNADENCFEIVHDETCDLAGRRSKYDSSHRLSAASD